MATRYGFLVVAAGVVSAAWIVGRVLEEERTPTWWIWLLLGFGLIAAARSLTPDAVAVHTFVPATAGTVLAVLGWFLFQDNGLDLRLHIGLGVGFGFIVGALGALSMALTKTANPDS